MATETTVARRRLVYALPCRPPIPFPAHPSYPVHVPKRDIRQAYTDSLWPPADSTHSEQATLEAFARSLLALAAERPPAEYDSLARQLVLPLHEFDRRWRDRVPAAIERDGDHSGEGCLGEEEARRARDDYARWAIEERARLEEERRKAEEKRRKGKQPAVDQDGAAAQLDEDEDDTAPSKEVVVRSDGWLSEKELLETRLQSLILLTLLSLPATFIPTKPRKGKRKKHPELFSDTLDPAMLLDFLTDRMQIWRVMRDVGGIGIAGERGAKAENDLAEPLVAVEEKDLVQQWWMDIVEPLFRTRVDASILSHHRLKLFPSSATQAIRLAQRLEPAPSPFKARSLLSLEKSARKREMREDERRVAQSPTMKRLMIGARNRDMPTAGGEVGDVFKVPGVPLKRKDGSEKTHVDDAAAAVPAPRPRLPRKQERPRPLPRGDNMAGVPDVLKRRVVSLSKKPSATSVLAKKKAGAANGGDATDGLKRKRKAVSPKKSTAADRAAHSLTLVPDTPSKSAAASTSASFRKPFSRATSMPSFAALGAAFRAGAGGDAPRLPPPFDVPSPPPFGVKRSRDARLLELEEEESAGEAYDSDEEMASVEGGADRVGARRDGLSTPKKQVVAQVLVPDT